MMRIFREKKWKNFAKKKKIMRKKNSRKLLNFQNQMQNFSEKIAKIHQKRLNFENTRLLFKEGFIDGLKQNINIDLRTTMETFHRFT